jgi:hypothetical protein
MGHHISPKGLFKPFLDGLQAVELGDAFAAAAGMGLDVPLPLTIAKASEISAWL